MATGIITISPSRLKKEIRNSIDSRIVRIGLLLALLRPALCWLLFGQRLLHKVSPIALELQSVWLHGFN